MYSKVRMQVGDEVILMATVKTPTVDLYHRETEARIRNGQRVVMTVYHDDGYGYEVRSDGRFNAVSRPLPRCPKCECPPCNGYTVN